MKTRRAVWALGLCTLASIGRAADTVSGELGNALDQSLLRSQLGQFWGAVGAVKDGKVVLAKGYGLANGTLTPNSSTTLFDIGSVTKQFTAAAILRLEMDGKISTDDRAAMWVDDVPRENQAITIFHLLTHTSGISQRDMQHPEADDGAKVATAALAPAPKSAPGERWEYSNAAYFALAAIIERASGQSYERYLREHLFAPAGMTATRIMGDAPVEGEVAADRVGQSGRARGNAAAWPYPVKWGYIGAGGVVSNVDDMLAWDAALRTDQVLNAAAREKFFTAFKKDYALGWQCEKTPQGRAVSHSGGVEGFVTFYTRWLDTHATVVVLSNERSSPQIVEKMLRNGLFPPEGPALTLEANIAALALNEFGGADLRGAFTITGGAEGKAVTVRIVDPAKAAPFATLTMSQEEAAAVLAQLDTALDGKAPDAAESACGLYTRPYPMPADGLLRVTGPGVSCVVTASMNERGARGSEVDRRITLSVRDEDNSFMPLMLRMNHAMAKELREVLTRR